MLNYQTMKIEDIINWCKENNEVEWLKATAAKEFECKVYPRVKVVNDEGNIVSKVDKNQPYTIEKRRITFIQLKQEFVAKFMPEIAPKTKSKKATMFDLIAAL